MSDTIRRRAQSPPLYPSLARSTENLSGLFDGMGDTSAATRIIDTSYELKLLAIGASAWTFDF